ncbi:MAG: YggS family pyridoxal phosphate-dependent enzyme [Chloroflexota bacterium]
MSDTSIADRLAHIRDSIDRAAVEVGSSGNVTLVAVSKTVSAGQVFEAYQAGQRVFGENRVQEAAAKIESLTATMPHADWHLIGHLQTNKVRSAAGIFTLIESVDSLRLANHLERVSIQTERGLPVLLEVNVAGEDTKGGFAPEDMRDVVGELLQLQHLQLRGLMTVAPVAERGDDVRWVFRRLRELAADLRLLYDLPHFDQLSMGMSNDFEAAVKEGATMIRIGRAIFGERVAPAVQGKRAQ